MVKSNWTFIIFIFIGLLAGVIIGELLSGVEWLAFLLKSAQISWQPKGDFVVLKYDFDFQVKLNLISILGIVFAIWIYRRL